jgi:MFS transporter, DHA1 family, multidrug resistance protein
MWRRNLWILWIGTFFAMAGMNLIVPFLPLYVQDLGIKDLNKVEEWSGMIFAATPLLAGLLAPFWGRVSDQYGRKIMLIRSGIGMAIVMTLMGFVQNSAQLLSLRLLMGTVAGFIPVAVALQATETPKEYAGRALGILQTGGVSGSLIGPLLGGALAEWIGIRHVFYLTGILLFIAAVVVIVGVHESKPHDKFTFRGLVNIIKRKKSEHKAVSMRDLDIYPLFLTSFLIFFGIQCIEPVITVYVQSLNVQSHLEMISGLVFAANGIGTIIAAPFLGRLGDKIGQRKVLLLCLFMMSILYIPQAFVSNAWVVVGLRLLSGLFVGGLVPSVNTLIRKFTPTDSQGTVYGFNQMANAMGMVAGPLFGGFMASHFGIPSIFFCSCALFALNLIVVAKKIPMDSQTSTITESATFAKR